MDFRGHQLGYVPELDGMRGFAICAVLITHAGPAYFRAQYIGQGGFIGVDVFFVLSGFLITALLVKEYDRANGVNLKQFYMRRALRLAPALILMLLTFIGLSVLFLDEAKVESNLLDVLLALFYSANWARAFNIHPPDFLAHTWSLSVEEQFYILWPVILIIFLRHIRSRWQIVSIVSLLSLCSWALRIYLASNGASIDRLFNGLDTRADALLVGCVVGIVLSSNLLSDTCQNSLAKGLRFITPLSAITLVFVGCIMDWHSLQMYYWLFFIVECLTAIIILDVFVSRHSFVKSILATRSIVWIGRISYGLYLWHFPVYRTLESVGYRGMTIVYGTWLTFLIASLSYYCLERPCLKLKRYANPRNLAAASG